MFVVERRGTIRVVQGGRLLPGFFLDAQDVVVDGGERGLLGLAFHPGFRTNRHLYVTYTRSGGDIVIARYTANSTRTAVPRSSFRALLVIEHSAAANHNGGAMAFYGVQERVREILETTKLVTVLEIFADEESGLKKLRSAGPAARMESSSG